MNGGVDDIQPRGEVREDDVAGLCLERCGCGGEGCCCATVDAMEDERVIRYIERT